MARFGGFFTPWQRLEKLKVSGRTVLSVCVSVKKVEQGRRRDALHARTRGITLRAGEKGKKEGGDTYVSQRGAVAPKHGSSHVCTVRQECPISKLVH